METAKRIEITALAQNELVLIVKDANGKYWLLGKDEPVMATAGEGVTRNCERDRNGYSSLSRTHLLRCLMRWRQTSWLPSSVKESLRKSRPHSLRVWSFLFYEIGWLYIPKRTDI